MVCTRVPQFGGSFRTTRSTGVLRPRSSVTVCGKIPSWLSKYESALPSTSADGPHHQHCCELDVTVRPSARSPFGSKPMPLTPTTYGPAGDVLSMVSRPEKDPDVVGAKP